MDLAIALGLLAAIWYLLAALIRWAGRWVPRRRDTGLSWKASTLISAGVIALASAGVLTTVILGERAPPAAMSPPSVESASPSAQSSLPSSALPDIDEGASAPRATEAPAAAPGIPAPAGSDLESASGQGRAPASVENPYPEFPWPPPPSSAEIVVPNSILLAGIRRPVRLSSAARVLARALLQAGYSQNAYYAVPNGFALVARLERIHEDGTPYLGLARFDSAFIPLPTFSLAGYLHALFNAPVGYYRVIVFVITNIPFAATGTPVSSREANLWIERGANVLPGSIARTGYSAGYVCTALIYEFEKHNAQSDPVEDQPGPLSADTNLIKARIAEALKWPLQ